MLSEFLNAFTNLTSDLFIIANHPLPKPYHTVPAYPDLIPGKGPLSGIHAALSAARNPLVLIVACDMPFITPDAAGWLMPYVLKNPGKVIIPLGIRGPEPMFGIWPVAVLTLLESWLQKDKPLKIMHFLEFHDLPSLIPFRVDPSAENFFFNINSPDDLTRAARFPDESGT